MLDPVTLERAVQLQRKAYRLLRWFQGHLDSAVFPAHEAHAAMGSAMVARSWLESYVVRFPEDAAPEPVELEELSSMFASYLTTSFDLVTDPLNRVASRTGCMCDVCTYMARCSTLQPKRLTAGDKAHAKRLKTEVLKRLAAEHDRDVAAPRFPTLLKDPAIDERAALLAYANQLLLRLSGDPGDPSILALWRDFAWTRDGSPKRGYVLSSSDILSAERDLVRVVLEA